MNASNNRLRSLQRFGQSIWIDYIHRALLASGEFAALVRDDGISGVTSNPVIFEEAIARSDAYTPALAAIAREGVTPEEAYERLAIEDIRAAADVLFPVYRDSGKRDGYVSLEVSPHLAHDTQGTIAEARRLWEQLARPNVMIKIPGTRAGLPAIAQATAEGINVNVTLLFSVERYQDVAAAYLSGLEQRLSDGHAIDDVVSVASFFLSRIDTAVDKQLDAQNASALRGQAAIASARLAYQAYKRLLSTPRWAALAAKGARPQRLLWASTSSKDPAYPETKYVDALIGADTVNTVPLKTLEAYRTQGDPAPRLEQELDRAEKLPEELRKLGIDLAQVADNLEREGIKKFVEPYDRLLATVAARMESERPQEQSMAT